MLFRSLSFLHHRCCSSSPPVPQSLRRRLIGGDATEELSPMVRYPATHSPCSSVPDQAGFGRVRPHSGDGGGYAASGSCRPRRSSEREDPPKRHAKGHLLSPGDPHASSARVAFHLGHSTSKVRPRRPRRRRGFLPQASPLSCCASIQVERPRLHNAYQRRHLPCRMLEGKRRNFFPSSDSKVLHFHRLSFVLSRFVLSGKSVLFLMEKMMQNFPRLLMCVLFVPKCAIQAQQKTLHFLKSSYFLRCHHYNHLILYVGLLQT